MRPRGAPTAFGGAPAALPGAMPAAVSPVKPMGFDAGGSTSPDQAGKDASGLQQNRSFWDVLFNRNRGPAANTANTTPLDVDPGPKPADWKSINDPTRTAAFNPVWDANDPGNYHTVDKYGRVVSVGPTMQGSRPANVTASKPVTNLTSSKAVTDAINKMIGVPDYGPSPTSADFGPPPAPTGMSVPGQDYPTNTQPGSLPMPSPTATRVPVPAPSISGPTLSSLRPWLHQHFGGQPGVSGSRTDTTNVPSTDEIQSWLQRHFGGRPGGSRPTVVPVPAPTTPAPTTRDSAPTTSELQSWLQHHFGGKPGGTSTTTNPDLQAWLNRFRQTGQVYAGGGRVAFARGGDSSSSEDTAIDDYLTGLHLGAYGPSHAVVASSPLAPLPPLSAAGSGGGGGDMSSLMKILSGGGGDLLSNIFGTKGTGKSGSTGGGSASDPTGVLTGPFSGVTNAGPQGSGAGGAYTAADFQPGGAGYLGDSGLGSGGFGADLSNAGDFLNFARGGRPGFMRGGYPDSFNQPPLAMPGLPQRMAFSGQGYVPSDGRGNGRSDHIDAALSPGEYVMDAETTSLLGDGDNEAGARKLEQMRHNIRKHKGAQLAAGKFSPKAKEPEAYLSPKLSAADRLAHSGISDGLRRRR